MPDWAGQEKLSETLARWRREECPPCVKRPEEKEGPVRFRVMPDHPKATRESEQFSCAAHLAHLIDFFSRRGFDSVVKQIRMEGEN